MGDERVQGDLDAGRDRAAQVVAVGVDRVVGDGGAEVDHDHRPSIFGVRGQRVGDAIGADVLGIVVANPDSGLDARSDHHRLALQVAP